MNLKNNSLKHILLTFVFLLTLGIGSALSQGGGKVKISGTVTEPAGNAPLPGVSIIIKSTSTGVITDYDGIYEIEATQGQTLIFSFLGMVSKEVLVGDKTTLNITLEYDTQQLTDVVVIGYGVSKKTDVTGAVSSVNSDDLIQGSITNPLQQIAGKMAGVTITQSGSEPGANPTVRIRGITSLIGGNDPLVVVDGVQGNMDLLNQVSPSEIETIDVLKDASATAIYGSRGAPGVIIVTTKRAKEGKTTVEYSGTMSVDYLANKLEMLSADEWRAEAKNWNVPSSTDHGSDTDWYGLLTQTGKTQNHTVAISGGANKFNYRASMTAIQQEGIVINSNNDNYIARVTATQKALDDKLTITVNLNNSITKKVGSPDAVGRAAFTSALITNAYVSKPTDPVLFEDGSYFYDPTVFQYINPYAVAQSLVNESEIQSQFGSFKADLELFRGLKLGTFGSWRKKSENKGYYAPSASTLEFARANNGVANVTTNLTEEKQINVSLNYDTTAGKHKISALAVYEWQSQLYQGNYSQAKGFINDLAAYNALQLGSSTKFLPGDISSYKNDRKLISLLGRANYSYADRYLLTVSFRRDGSSVFGNEHKWGNFPSVSVAWRITEEAFMKDINVLTNLKLRAGYGITGNQQGLNPQQSLQLVGQSGTTYFNGNILTNFGVTQNSNSDLTWETRSQTNIGLDFGFFDNKLSGSVDVFTATTDNLLFNYTVPQPPYPFGSMVANIGSLKNEGIELALNYQLIDTRDLSVNLAANASFLRNEVLKLSGYLNGVELTTNYVSWGQDAYLIEGQPVASYNILQNNGKDENNEELVLDANNDGEIDLSAQSKDRHLAGNTLPTYSFAFTPSVRYKNFDLSMVWRASGGNKIYNRTRKDFSMYESLGKSNLMKSAADLGLFTSKYSSDLWLEDGDFLRFENLTVGYTLSPKTIPYVQTARVSVTANNLALFTKYTGLDPELDPKLNSVDVGIYPRTRSISVGLNVTF